MENKENPKEIIDKISGLQSELQEIQSNCTHEPIIKFDNDKKAVVRRCELCDKLLGYATEQERKDHGFGNK